MITERAALSETLKILIQESYPEIPGIENLLEMNYERYLKTPEKFTRQMRATFRLYKIMKELNK